MHEGLNRNRQAGGEGSGPPGPQSADAILDGLKISSVQVAAWHLDASDMGLLRSEDMKHGTLILPVERARYFLNILGAGGNIQFEDMHKEDHQRAYKRYIQRIDEMERIIRFLREAVERLPGWEGGIVSGDIDGFLAHEQEYNLDELEVELKRLDKEFRLLQENAANVLESRNQLTEEYYVARLATALHAPKIRRPSQEQLLWASREIGEKREFEKEARHPRFHDFGIAVHESTEDGMIVPLSVAAVAGVIDIDVQGQFERALFRSTRGNAFVHFQQISEPLPGPYGQGFKAVFVIYYQSRTEVPSSIGHGSPRRSAGGSSAMHAIIMRVCRSYRAHLTTWYDSLSEAEAGKAHHERQMAEQTHLLEEVRNYMKQEARRLVERVRYPDGNSRIEEWRLFCVKEKTIYAALNLFEGNTNLHASCWYPADREDGIRNLLVEKTWQPTSDGRTALGAMLIPDRAPPRVIPPTYFKKNEFTAVIQELIDAYGICRYKEANPMLLTIVTFPFLFGIMYGDVGHGLILFISGLICCWKGDLLRASLPDLYMARYLVVLMGFFSIYAGFMYSELFSLGFQILPSRWEVNATAGNGHGVQMVAKYDIMNQGGLGPYPFGVDPAWQAAKNKMEFLNSLKMKLSVIIGVLQMMAGLLLRCANAFHEKSVIDFFCECVPMMVFLVCFLGFMDAMIVYKWVTPLANHPSIVTSVICMMMRMTPDPAPMFGRDMPLYLLIAIGISVLWLLISKPLILYIGHTYCRGCGCSWILDWRTRNLSQATYAQRVRRSSFYKMLADGGHAGVKDGKDHFDFGEVIVHTVIEAIEYVLGTVSHTASYLRLWALSLAHGQLGEVFYSMTIGGALSMPFPLNGFALYFCFSAWLAITFGILLGMDVMECALHTLRLHWVEFQSKFFRGDGYAFEPFSHRAVLIQAIS